MTPRAGHPDFETLFSYHEGVLEVNEVRKVETHLASCRQCQLEIDRLRAAAASASPRGQAPNAPPVSDLLANLARLERSLAQDWPSGDALKRVESELIPYLGDPAANQILRPVAPSGENLLSTIDAVLRPFLGKAATARLVSRIVERAIMRP